MVRGIIMSDKNKNTENEVNDQNEELEPISKDEESPDAVSYPHLTLPTTP